MGYTVYINNVMTDYKGIVNVISTPTYELSHNNLLSLWITLCEDYCTHMANKYYIKDIINKLKILMNDMTKESIIATLNDVKNNNFHTDNPNSHTIMLYTELINYSHDAYVTFTPCAL